MNEDLRRASLEEIIALRTRVLRPHFSESQLANFDGDTDPDTSHFAYERDGEIVGVLTVRIADAPESVTVSGPSCQIRGMAIAPEFQGQGIGGRLMSFALTRFALQHPEIKTAWCNARLSAEDFYARYGWTPTGDVFDVPQIGPHVVMHRPMPVLLAG